MSDMLCDACQKNPAQIHYSEMINGKFSEFHLCESCAKDKGMTLVPFASHFSAGDLLSSLVEIPFGLQASEGQSEPSEACPCGMTLKAFKQTGFLGCPECYKTFKKPLEAVLRQIHGSAEHVGVTPAKVAKGGLTKAERIKRLKKDLTKAIELEHFEEAAALRDKLKGLETE